MTSYGSVSVAVAELLRRYGLETVVVEEGAPIPGSYWGDREAGLIGSRLYARADTPLHSVLHEASHYICMDTARRNELDRDAGGDYDEENAVCYLQILLADELRSPGGAGEAVGSGAMCRDMDEWGYTFRLGSARAWFEEDAQDARAWLIAHGIIDARGAVTGRKRR